MFKQEWPSERKLERLREAGELPCSKFTIACASALAVGIWGFTARSGWQNFLGHYRSLLEAPPNAASLEEVRALIDAAANLLIVPASAALVAGLTAGLVQTRFFFRLSLLSLNFGRLNPFRPPEFAAVVLRVGAALSVLFAGVLLSCSAAWLLYPAAAAMLVQEPQRMLFWPCSALRSAAPLIFTALGAGAVAAWLAKRFAYLVRHRMTREEIEAELR